MKRNYLESFETKEDFVKFINTWSLSYTGEHYFLQKGHGLRASTGKFPVLKNIDLKSVEKYFEDNKDKIKGNYHTKILEIEESQFELIENTYYIK